MTDREILERLLYSLATSDNMSDVFECVITTLSLMYAQPNVLDAPGTDRVHLLRHLGITKGLWSE